MFTRKVLHSAFFMPLYLDADVESLRPCKVIFTQGNRTEIKELAYNAQGQLKSSDTTITEGVHGKMMTSKGYYTYNAQGHITTIKNHPDGDWKLSYTYDKEGMLTGVSQMVKSDEGPKPSMGRKVTRSKDGKTAMLDLIHPDGSLRKPLLRAAYTFDEQGRVVFSKSAFERTRSQWNYYPVDPGTNTQRVEYFPGSKSTRRFTHTLLGNRLVRSVWATQDANTKKYVPYRTETYTYDDDKLVSAKTVNLKTGALLEAVTYIHTCS
jgi:YD repeat-containing protein